MARPMQTVKVYGVQDRRSTVQAKLPWVVRFTIDGRHRSKSFRTRIEADRYRGLLLQAVQDGGRFNETTGEPESWQTPLADVRVHEWSRRWLAEQWPEWQPRTRASATEALARFITLASCARVTFRGNWSNSSTRCTEPYGSSSPCMKPGADWLFQFSSRPSGPAVSWGCCDSLR